MDVQVYKKERVIQPQGAENVYVPNVIDIIPDIHTDSLGNEVLYGATLLEEDNDIIEQMCGLATIWQKGLDPLDLENGIRWSEALLEEINVVQLMEDLTNAVAEITPTVDVVFDTVTGANGEQYLKYTLKAVA
jgi:hypothetical protein